MCNYQYRNNFNVLGQERRIMQRAFINGLSGVEYKHIMSFSKKAKQEYNYVQTIPPRGELILRRMT